MTDETETQAAARGNVVTIRGLAPGLKQRLRIRAAHKGHSMEAEARAILEAGLAAPEEDPTDLASFARSLFMPLGGADLSPPPREPGRETPAVSQEPKPAAPSPAAPAPHGGKPLRTKPAVKATEQAKAGTGGKGRRR